MAKRLLAILTASLVGTVAVIGLIILTSLVFAGEMLNRGAALLVGVVGEALIVLIVLRKARRMDSPDLGDCEG